jgi:membrane associated rhomboid family serine protease
VTKAIIALNILVFLATAVRGDLRSELVLSGPAVANGEWYRLLTSGFVHFGLLHIAFNMLILYRFGEMLEPALGRVRMAALYLAALLTGSLGVVLLQPQASTAGASGAVFGLVAAAAVGLRQRGIDVWQSGVGPLLAINLFLTFIVPGISIGGHLGGMAGGALLGSVMLHSPADRRSVTQGLATAVLVAVLSVAGAVSAAHAHP